MFIIQYQEVNIVITITTNRELAQSVIKAIQDSKISKEELLQKIELTEKEYDILLQKESFSIDDANKILKEIGRAHV